jgi:hypothetical protein
LELLLNGVDLLDRGERSDTAEISVQSLGELSEREFTVSVGIKLGEPALGLSNLGNDFS